MRLGLSLAKAFVPGHWRKIPDGTPVYVRAYTDSRPEARDDAQPSLFSAPAVEPEPPPVVLPPPPPPFNVHTDEWPHVQDDARIGLDKIGRRAFEDLPAPQDIKWRPEVPAGEDPWEWIGKQGAEQRACFAINRALDTLNDEGIGVKPPYNLDVWKKTMLMEASFAEGDHRRMRLPGVTHGKHSSLQQGSNTASRCLSGLAYIVDRMVTAHVAANSSPGGQALVKDGAAFGDAVFEAFNHFGLLVPEAIPDMKRFEDAMLAVGRSCAGSSNLLADECSTMEELTRGPFGAYWRSAMAKTSGLGYKWEQVAEVLDGLDVETRFNVSALKVENVRGKLNNEATRLAVEDWLNGNTVPKMYETAANDLWSYGQMAERYHKNAMYADNLSPARYRQDAARIDAILAAFLKLDDIAELKTAMPQGAASTKSLEEWQQAVAGKAEAITRKRLTAWIGAKAPVKAAKGDEAAKAVLRDLVLEKIDSAEEDAKPPSDKIERTIKSVTPEKLAELAKLVDATANDEHHFTIRLMEAFEVEHDDPTYEMIAAQRDNERQFFHGSEKQNAYSILATKLRATTDKQVKVGTANGQMYGPGIYLADQSTKAGVYVKKRRELPKGQNSAIGYMYVVSASLGKVHEERGRGHDVSTGAFRKGFGSVEAVTRDSGGQVFNPEFIVPGPESTKIRYLLKVMKTFKDRS